MEWNCDGILCLEDETLEDLQDRIERLIEWETKDSASIVLTRELSTNLDFYVTKQHFSGIPRGVIEFASPILKIEIDDEEESTPELYNKMFDDLFAKNVTEGWSEIKKQREKTLQKNKEQEERQLLATLKAKYE